MSLPKDSLKCIQDAWYKLLVDFRAWYMPETILTNEWKKRDIGIAIKSCPSRMMDDSEAMLAEYRKNQNADVVAGATAFMPIMLTATAAIDQPPDTMQLIPMPYFVPILIGDKQVRIRLIAKTVRAQIAFFATNSHDAKSVCDQFCTYVQDETKRRFAVPFDMGMGHIQKSTFTLVENQLFPSPVPSEAINLSIFTVDAQLIGYAPQIIGLGGPFDNDTGNGYNPDGSAVETPINDSVVVQADQFADDGHTRVLADRDTGEITVERIND
ncbi:hypothetical protein [Acinetobacter sp. Ac_5812]|uniref:hypothetical protein n=1 Tax=Acinetobacter sp. Ac_5812 TaxID=1848937 RepID=UPI00148FFEF4|nr:hypothetical protein [Acinetobacter sp. Ac_5812]NNP70401.1 hypothetical protein [Acinetobacter sp. Ac_5812]